VKPASGQGALKHPGFIHLMGRNREYTLWVLKMVNQSSHLRPTVPTVSSIREDTCEEEMD